VKQIGEIRPVNAQLISSLSSPDRNYLLMELRKLTFGNDIEANYACPVCSEHTHVSQDLEELPVRKLNGEGPSLQITVELVDGFEDKGNLYDSLVFRLPNGIDEERVAGISRDNPSRGMTALLTRCLVGLGEMASDRRESLGTKVINDLTMSDRARIEQAFRDEMPGVDMTADGGPPPAVVLASTATGLAAAVELQGHAQVSLAGNGHGDPGVGDDGQVATPH